MALHIEKTDRRLARAAFTALLATMIAVGFSVVQFDMRNYLPVILLGLLILAFVFFFVLEAYFMLYDMFKEPITPHTVTTIGFTLTAFFITAIVVAAVSYHRGWKLGCVYGMGAALLTMFASKLLKWTSA